MSGLSAARQFLRSALVAPSADARLTLLGEAVASVESLMAESTESVPPSSAMPWLPSYALALALARAEPDPSRPLELLESAHACCVEQARLGMGSDAHFGVVGTASDLARLRLRAGDLDGAQALAKRSLYVVKNAWGGGDALLSAEAFALSGEVLRQRGEGDAANEALEESKNLARGVTPKPSSAPALVALGAALASTASATLRAGSDMTMAPDALVKALDAVEVVAALEASSTAAAGGSGGGGDSEEGAQLWATASAASHLLGLGLAHARVGESAAARAAWARSAAAAAAEDARVDAGYGGTDARSAALRAACTHNLAHLDSVSGEATAAAAAVVALHGGRLSLEADGRLLWAPPLLECTGAALALAFDDAHA